MKKYILSVLASCLFVQLSFAYQTVNVDTGWQYFVPGSRFCASVEYSLNDKRNVGVYIYVDVMPYPQPYSLKTFTPVTSTLVINGYYALSPREQFPKYGHTFGNPRFQTIFDGSPRNIKAWWENVNVDRLKEDVNNFSMCFTNLGKENDPSTVYRIQAKSKLAPVI
jgi:hypothetical protein